MKINTQVKKKRVKLNAWNLIPFLKENNTWILNVVSHGLAGSYSELKLSLSVLGNMHESFWSCFRLALFPWFAVVFSLWISQNLFYCLLRYLRKFLFVKQGPQIWFWEIKFEITVFSQLNAPRRLFQTWHGGTGVSLNNQFIWARQFLRKGYYSFFLAAVYLALKS